MRTAAPAGEAFAAAIALEAAATIDLRLRAGDERGQAIDAASVRRRLGLRLRLRHILRLRTLATVLAITTVIAISALFAIAAMLARLLLLALIGRLLIARIGLRLLLHRHE